MSAPEDSNPALSFPRGGLVAIGEDSTMTQIEALTCIQGTTVLKPSAPGYATGPCRREPAGAGQRLSLPPRPVAWAADDGALPACFGAKPSRPAPANALSAGIQN